MPKTIFITGASKGLGLSIARKFHNEGWNVSGTSRYEEGIKIIEENMPGSRAYICNISDQEQVKKSLYGAYDHFGSIDVLVNNAAIKAKGRLDTFDSKTISSLIETNLLGAIIFSNHALNIMRRQREGHIISICSTYALTTSSNFSLYCAAKHGLRGFSLSLMKEMAPEGIKISTVYPGGMNTSFHDSPRPMFLDPCHVANAVYYIASQPKDIFISELVITPMCEREYIDKRDDYSTKQ